MAAITAVTPKMFVVKYDGTNSAQIIGLMRPGTVTNVVEANGVLNFVVNGYQSYAVAQGTFAAFVGDGAYASAAMGGAGYTAAELVQGFIAVAPGTLPT